MVQTKFICEQSLCDSLTISTNGNLVAIDIQKKYDCDVDPIESLSVELTIEDAERLMDELHRVIIEIEKSKKEKGGKND
jgi:hypothetical protein